MAQVLDVQIDIAEPRVLLDRQAILISGLDWDVTSSAGIGVEQVTHTAMLAPAPFLPNWQTTNTGIYARTTKAATSVAGSTNWTEYSRGRFDGDNALVSLNNNVQVTFDGPWPKNRPHFLSIFSHNAGDEVREEWRCGWGTAPDANLWVSGWSDGHVYVYDGTAVIGQGNLIDQTDTGYTSDYGAQGFQQSAPGREMANRFVEVALFPCRRRELLLLSNQGGGFTTVLDRITDTDPDPTIADAGPFWYVRQAGQANVQHAPIKFLSAGTLLSPPYRLRYVPPTGATYTVTPYYDAPGYGAVTVAGTLVQTDGTTVYVPDGTIGTVRVQVALTGDGDATPYVYGAKAVFDGTQGTTSSEPNSLIGWCDTVTLDVPESPADVRLHLQMRSPQAVEDAGVTAIRRIGNRPIEAAIGGTVSGTVAILNGRTTGAHWDVGISDGVSHLAVECQDRWRALETYRIQEPTPFDGMLLEDAVKELVGYTGYGTVEMDVEATGFAIPGVTQASANEWAWMPAAGDTAGDWLIRLWETFARTYYMGWVPTASGPMFRFVSTATLGTAASGTLYNSHALGGTVYRMTDEATLEPEANDLWIWGRDSRSGLPLLAHYADTVSMAPDTAVNARPENWLGEPRRYSLREPGLTTQTACNWASTILAERLTPIRRMREWECEFLVKSDGAPVWRGDCVTLVGMGNYRVETLSAQFVREYDGGSVGGTLIWRPTRYTGVFVGSA